MVLLFCIWNSHGAVFWCIMPCILVDMDHRFGGSCCLRNSCTLYRTQNIPPKVWYLPTKLHSVTPHSTLQLQGTMLTFLGNVHYRNNNNIHIYCRSRTLFNVCSTNGRMLSDYWIESNPKGSDREIIWGSIPAFTQLNRGKRRATCWWWCAYGSRCAHKLKL